MSKKNWNCTTPWQWCPYPEIGYPAHTLQDKIRSKTCIHALPCVLQPRILPPYLDRLWRCNVSYGSRPYLTAKVGPALPRVQMLWTSPPNWDRLRRHHVFWGSRPCNPARKGSDTATCPTAPNPASLLGRAPTLTRVLRFLMVREPHV
jgi:hypothetical protein